MKIELDKIKDIDLSPLYDFLCPNDSYGMSSYFKAPIGEHYKLLAYFSTLFKDSLYLDIGTLHGHSAVALSYANHLYYPYQNRVISFDVHEDKCRGNVNLDFADRLGIHFIIDDIFKCPRLVRQAKLILVDTAHAGGFESMTIDLMMQEKFCGLALFDDIHLNVAMENFWHSVELPKWDLTEWGHHSGTGLVSFVDNLEIAGLRNG